MHLRARFTRALAAAVVAAASFSSPVVAGPDATTKTTADLSTVRIDNFGQINANYYRGAQPRGADYETLAAIGVKTLINLTSSDAAPDEEAMAERAGLTYIQIPMTTRRAPTEAQLAEFLRIVNDPAHQPVYVHCVGGKHRTGVMTAAYRMTKDGWTADQAYDEMKRYNFGPSFLHPEFKTYVYAFPAAPVREAHSMMTP